MLETLLPPVSQGIKNFLKRTQLFTRARTTAEEMNAHSLEDVNCRPVLLQHSSAGDHGGETPSE